MQTGFFNTHDKQWFLFNNGDTEDYVSVLDGYVIAWQPLPEPYKGE